MCMSVVPNNNLQAPNRAVVHLFQNPEDIALKQIRAQINGGSVLIYILRATSPIITFTRLSGVAPVQINFTSDIYQ